MSTASAFQTSGYVCGCCRAQFAERFIVCPSCWESGVCVPNYVRKIESVVGARGRRVTARALASEDMTTDEISVYPGILYQPNSFIIVHGGQASGKTTMTLRIAESMTPSAFCAAEMKVGPAMSAYLRRLEVRSSDITIFDETAAESVVEVARSGIRCLVIDSLSILSFLPDDILGLARDANLVIIGILQHVKSGEAQGSRAWLHAADVVISCSEMTWKVEKSRYSEIGATGGVL